MVSLDLVSQKEENPAAHKKTYAPYPLHEEKQNDPQKNHGDTNAVKKLIPARRVLVIVLRHIVRQTGQSAPPCGGDDSAEMKLYTQNGLVARGGHTY